MKAITFTIVTKKAQSLNYGETIGNVSILKKLTVGDNKKLITYVSDKAIKYDIKRIGKEAFQWKLMDESVANTIKSCFVNKNNKDGEFDYNKFYEEMVKNYQEFDLFGGMFADIGNVYDDKKNKTININGQKVNVNIDTTKLQRTAPVRITNAYSVSEFVYDNNLLNDIDAYNRYIQYTAGDKKQTLAYSDEHKSYYVYSILIDLEQVGCIKSEDGTWKQVKTSQEKKDTIIQLLDILFFKLCRNIRGRIENLTPVFVIGGIYSYKHPIFHNSLKIEEGNRKVVIENIDQAMKNLQPQSNGETYLFYDQGCVEVEIKDNNLENKDLESILVSLKSKIKEVIKNLVNNKKNELKKKYEIQENQELDLSVLLKRFEPNEIEDLFNSIEIGDDSFESSLRKIKESFPWDIILNIKRILGKIRDLNPKDNTISLNINGQEKKIEIKEEEIFNSEVIDLCSNNKNSDVLKEIQNKLEEKLESELKNKNKKEEKEEKNEAPVEDSKDTSSKNTPSETSSKRRGRSKK